MFFDPSVWNRFSMMLRLAATLQDGVVVLARSGRRVRHVKARGKNPEFSIEWSGQVHDAKRVPNETKPDRLWSSLLKSQIQKDVRRGNVVKALRASLALLEHDPNELLRRLPVIAFEDAIWGVVSPVVWLMASQSQDDAIWRECLGARYRDVVTRTVLSVVRWLVSCKQTGPHVHSSDMVAVRLRIAYGGTRHDMNLLQGARPVLSEPYICPVFDEPVEPLKRSQISSYAADHHPLPRLVRLVSRKAKVPEKRVRHLIWVCSSSRNFRKPAEIPPDVQVQWRSVRPVMREVAGRLLSEWS